MLPGIIRTSKIFDICGRNILQSRASIPPGTVSEQASSLYNSVNSAVEPYAYRLGKTLQDDVAPTVKDAVKTSLNAVFTGVPSVISQVRAVRHNWSNHS